MITIEEALKLVAERSAPLAPRPVPIEAGAGLVLAEEIVSEWNSPPYSKAMMDGYAVISHDRAPVRQVIEEIAAGAVPTATVLEGTAARIMTGAPVPDGADAVVPVETTSPVGNDQVRFEETQIKSGQHILPLGASIRAGETVLRSGAVLRAVEIAILAEIGRTEVEAVPRPSAAILATGDELVDHGELPGSGQIRNSNGPMLGAAIEKHGARVEDLGIARDNREDLLARMHRAFEADVLLLSGGVSAGKYDLVPGILEELGVEPVFHKVALRPGKPLWFGVRQAGGRQTLVFGLPGNPVSGLVCFELFIRPAMSSLAGRGFIHPACISARLSHAYEHPGGRAACLPARVTFAGGESPGDVEPALRMAWTGPAHGTTVEILKWQGSADMAALAGANGLVRVRTEPARFQGGEIVDVILL